MTKAILEVSSKSMDRLFYDKDFRQGRVNQRIVLILPFTTE